MSLADGSGRLEIIFYIIAAIVGLAVNAYRNYSKRKMSEMKGPVEVEEEADFPEVIFEPVSDKQEPPWEEEIISETEMSSATEEVQEETPEFIKQDDVIDVVEEDEGTAALRATIEQINLENQNTEDIPITDYFIKDNTWKDQEISDFTNTELSDEEIFDLRKAVIYSEILKPKYINNNY